MRDASSNDASSDASSDVPGFTDISDDDVSVVCVDAVKVFSPFSMRVPKPLAQAWCNWQGAQQHRSRRLGALNDTTGNDLLDKFEVHGHECRFHSRTCPTRASGWNARFGMCYDCRFEDVESEDDNSAGVVYVGGVEWYRHSRDCEVRIWRGDREWIDGTRYAPFCSCC